MYNFSFVFFVIFVLIVLGVYLSIRRRWVAPSLTAVLGLVGGILAMMLFALAQGNIFLQALVVGVLLGGSMIIATLAIAMYFQGNEVRSGYSKHTSQPDV